MSFSYCDQSGRRATTIRSFGLALCAASVLLGANVAVAAGRGHVDDAQASYQRERANCMSGHTNQDRATCLREAGAAYQEARRGGLSDGHGDLDKNRMRRCEGQRPEDRDDCVRRMNGEGVTSGSVEGGGIYRELVRPVPGERQ